MRRTQYLGLPSPLRSQGAPSCTRCSACSAALRTRMFFSLRTICSSVALASGSSLACDPVVLSK
jgi:hypothetical protein